LPVFCFGKFGKTSPAKLRAGSQPHRFNGYRTYEAEIVEDEVFAASLEGMALTAKLAAKGLAV
jgi:hypothetical protein